MKTIKKHYRVDRKDISFLRFIFEAYDGIAIITTVNSAKGLIDIYIAPGCEDDVEKVLKSLSAEMRIEFITPGEGFDG